MLVRDFLVRSAVSEICLILDLFTSLPALNLGLLSTLAELIVIDVTPTPEFYRRCTQVNGSGLLNLYSI